jgi:dihydrofolate synthase / folylpolyglutamate synthase
VRDFAISEDPAVQAELDRIPSLPIGRDDVGLGPISTVLAALGNPERNLPPVFHVAGTNGKGSTCAFLRAAIEAAGMTAHVHTSPHLVRPNERIRVAGKLIEDAQLAALLKEVTDASEAVACQLSFFEAMTAAAFLAFARTPADAAIIEVGLGGRLDATNVIARPAVCGITQLGVDHQRFLGDTILDIAAEKAGISKAGVPLVTMDYAKPVAQRIEAVSAETGAIWHPRKGDWESAVYQGQLHYRDPAGKIALPLPRLTGSHQAENAALAVAMIRHQQVVEVPEAALRAAMGWAHWPARMQRLEVGPLTALLPVGSQIWLDGCHNPAGAEMLAPEVAKLDSPDFIMGILANKDSGGILAPLLKHAASFTAVPVPGHDHHDPTDLARQARGLGVETAATAPDVATALKRLAASGEPRTVLIIGTLYLAGVVLKANGQLPD